MLLQRGNTPLLGVFLLRSCHTIEYDELQVVIKDAAAVTFFLVIGCMFTPAVTFRSTLLYHYLRILVRDFATLTPIFSLTTAKRLSARRNLVT